MKSDKKPSIILTFRMKDIATIKNFLCIKQCFNAWLSFYKSISYSRGKAEPNLIERVFPWFFPILIFSCPIRHWVQLRLWIDTGGSVIMGIKSNSKSRSFTILVLAIFLFVNLSSAGKIKDKLKDIQVSKKLWVPKKQIFYTSTIRSLVEPHSTTLTYIFKSFDTLEGGVIQCCKWLHPTYSKLSAADVKM